MTQAELERVRTWLENLKSFIDTLPGTPDSPLAKGVFIDPPIDLLLFHLNNPPHPASRYVAGIYKIHRAEDGNHELARLLTLEQWESLNAIAREHEDKLHYSYSSDLCYKFRRILNHYQSNETKALSDMKSFREDVLVWMRAIALIADSVASAGTHQEGNARLRGLLSLIETSIQKIRDGQVQYGYLYRENPDVFRSDYPV